MEIIRFDIWVLQQALPAGAGKTGCSYYIFHVLVPESAQFFQKQKIKRFFTTTRIQTFQQLSRRLGWFPEWAVRSGSPPWLNIPRIPLPPRPWERSP